MEWRFIFELGIYKKVVYFFRGFVKFFFLRCRFIGFLWFWIISFFYFGLFFLVYVVWDRICNFVRSVLGFCFIWKFFKYRLWSVIFRGYLGYLSYVVLVNLFLCFIWEWGLFWGKSISLFIRNKININGDIIDYR